ncbi:hypothetical protein LIPSTDRAFT_107945 [Lipomyces starkeyi NRRL Y-11557]|uniref:Uncharacterized protein n=1 Tax=Lipomyces starkeyi NRRL Y-11557 TaxID=675824 RepID=A0A1E3PV31_LIPST|nr:hypothetical protein LIPSTDRAFT_107945 [Lipomyces starkeyi NRRL Y-11557]
MVFVERAILLSASSTFGHRSLAQAFGIATAIYRGRSLFGLVVAGKLVSRHNHSRLCPYAVSMGTQNALGAAYRNLAALRRPDQSCFIAKLSAWCVIFTTRIDEAPSRFEIDLLVGSR